MSTITLDQWNNASTEQRTEWLANGVQVRPEDAAALQRQINPGNVRHNHSAGSWMCPACENAVQ